MQLALIRVIVDHTTNEHVLSHLLSLRPLYGKYSGQEEMEDTEL